MISLLWLVFLVHLAIYLVNTIGASTIDNLVRYSPLSWLAFPPSPAALKNSDPLDLRKYSQLTCADTVQLWILYLKLPTSVSKDAREHYRLKREVVQLKREMNATSSQDEFAKWAKLRRRHDKALEEYEAKSSYPVTRLMETCRPAGTRLALHSFEVILRLTACLT